MSFIVTMAGATVPGAVSASIGIPPVPDRAGLLDAVSLIYVGIPSLFFMSGWIRPSVGWPASVALALCVAVLVRAVRPAAGLPSRLGIAAVLVTAAVWAVLGGVGHFVYANEDWVVRDSVLLDLVRMPWPVIYDTSSMEPALLLRAPLGFYLPAATVGKLFGIRAAELSLLAWIVAGVVLTLSLLLRDRPRPLQIGIRIAVFVVFSGMDIVGTMTHYKPYAIGDHLEWWAYLFQYSSHTTQLFWVPNHALPGWIAVAWLLGHEHRRLPICTAIVLLALVPIWSPLTAIGLAPIIGVAIAREAWRRRTDGRLPVGPDPAAIVCVVVCVLTCGLLVYPYLVLGSTALASGPTAAVPWIGEDIVPRYVEFVVIEFGLIAALLVWRYRRDALLLAGIAVLLALPLYRFGPANDLAMRASIPALALLAIRLGQWLSMPRTTLQDTQWRGVAVVLLVIGAATPFAEFARVFVEPRWSMDARHGLMEITRGPAPHYLTRLDRQWWTDLFLDRR